VSYLAWCNFSPPKLAEDADKVLTRGYRRRESEIEKDGSEKSEYGRRLYW
jgi:hypothetical protein